MFKWIKQYFPRENLKRFTFNVKLIDDRRKTKQENISSINLTQKVYLLRLWRGNVYFSVLFLLKRQQICV